MSLFFDTVMNDTKTNDTEMNVSLLNSPFVTIAYRCHFSSRTEYLQKWFAVLPEVAYDNIQVGISLSFRKMLLRTWQSRTSREFDPAPLPVHQTV